MLIQILRSFGFQLLKESELTEVYTLGVEVVKPYS